MGCSELIHLFSNEAPRPLRVVGDAAVQQIPMGPRACGIGPLLLDLSGLAGALKISPQSALYFLGKLARDGKATISGVQAAGLA